MKKFFRLILLILLLFSGMTSTYATKLVDVKVVDKDHIMLYFLDGEVTYPENISQLGSRAYTNSTNENDNA